MTPQELRTSLLKCAMEGKMVQQIITEGTAETVYAAAVAEREPLIKSKVIKKETLQEITDDEKPFEIPESWRYVRLNDLVRKTIKRGKSPTYTQNSNVLVFAQKCNVKTGGINMELAQFLDESKLSKYPEDEFMQDGDIVVNSTGNGTLGRIGIFHTDDNPRGLSIVPDSHVTVIRACNAVVTEYVYYYLKYCQPYLESLGEGSTNQTELKPDLLKNLVVGLPPLAEQHRIVAKIEELLPYIDRYEKAWTKLEEFNKKFPGDMQKSILQTAIQGKLVEQRAEEGTGEELYQQIQVEKEKLIKAKKIKKEKPLPDITEDEIPFEIPESWKWCRLCEIVSALGDGLHGTPTYDMDGDYYFVNGNNLNNGKILIKDDTKKVNKEEWEKYKKPLDDTTVLVSINGTLGNIAFYVDEKVMLGKSACYFNLLSKDMKYYIYWLIKSDYFMKYAISSATGTTIKNVSLKAMNNLLIPLPPLAEQKRIVAKLEEILPLCERLK